MYILAIETTGPFGSVALIKENAYILGTETSQDTMSHLKDLLPMTETLLKEAGIKKSDLSYIAASKGPGSFTGIRIGVSTARALSQALGIPAVGVPTLEAFMKKETAEKGQYLICAIINARRGQVYGMIDGILEPGPYMLSELLDILKFPANQTKPILFYGDGIDAYEETIKENLPEGSFVFAEKPERYQDAVSVARLALQLVEEGNTLSFEELLPEYMRKAEAEQKLEAGQLPICHGPRQE